MHKCRTPVNIIINFADLLKYDWDTKNYKTMGEYFSPIESAGERLIRTIGLILNMSQIQTGSYDANFEDINLNNLIENLISEFSIKAKIKSLTLKKTSSFSNIIVRCDTYSTNQIFANLIDNAIKYTENGGITISVETENNRMQVNITDTGIGISEEYREHLFKPFSQEQQGYSRKFDGNGLGLALIKKYCEINNAKIKYSRTLGKGSTFSVMFKQSYN